MVLDYLQVPARYEDLLKRLRIDSAGAPFRNLRLLELDSTPQTSFAWGSNISPGRLFDCAQDADLPVYLSTCFPVYASRFTPYLLHRLPGRIGHVHQRAGAARQAPVFARQAFQFGQGARIANAAQNTGRLPAQIGVRVT